MPHRPLLLRRIDTALEALTGIRGQPPPLSPSNDGIRCEVRGFEEDVRSLSAHGRALPAHDACDSYRTCAIGDQQNVWLYLDGPPIEQNDAFARAAKPSVYLAAQFRQV